MFSIEQELFPQHKNDISNEPENKIEYFQCKIIFYVDDSFTSCFCLSTNSLSRACLFVDVIEQFKCAWIVMSRFVVFGSLLGSGRSTFVTSRFVAGVVCVKWSITARSRIWCIWRNSLIASATNVGSCLVRSFFRSPSIDACKELNRYLSLCLETKIH